MEPVRKHTNDPLYGQKHHVAGGRIGRIVVASALLLSSTAFAQFAPGNLVVAVEGCGIHGGSASTCAAPNGTGTGTLNSSAGGFGDNQAAPLTLFQYAPSGTSSVTYVNSLVLPQSGSGANLPISGEYGSSSEATLQLSGFGQYLTIMGYGLDFPTFNANPATYGAAPSLAFAQSGSLTGQSYTAVPRVVTLIDANGNVNSSTALFNVFNNNNPRSVYTADGTNIYVSGQGNDDATGGVFYTTLGSSSGTSITGTDTISSGGTPYNQDTRMVQIYNNNLLVSFDTKEGTGFNRSGIGSLGDPPSTTLYNSPASSPVTSGPTALSGFQKTGKVTIATGAASNGNGLNNSTTKVNNAAQNLINLSPSDFFFAAPNVLYIADTGNPKNDSNGDNAIPSETNIGDGGLQKWVNSAADGSGTWSLKYTLYQGLNLVENTNSSGTSGLYGMTGVVNGATVSLYATNATLSDLDQTYLYGITDTLANTTPPGTSLAFTLLDTAPVDSNFKGVSFAPVTPLGGVTITSVPSGFAFNLIGTGCAAGNYTTPVTPIWTPGNSCTLSIAPTQSGAVGVQYEFSHWEDGTTNLTHTVISPPTPTTYTATFTTEYQLTTTAGTGGSVSPGGFIASGTSAVITATPADGYYFVNFTGTTTSTSNPLTLTMNGPQSITANFALKTTPTISWTAPSAITYGTPLSPLQLSATASVPGTFAYNPAAGTVLAAGMHPLSVIFTPTDTVHNNIATANSSILVNQAPLTVTANNLTVPYGTSNPALKATITGFVNGDPSSVVSGSPALSTTATPSSLPGPYPITVGLGSLAAANYSFTFVNGTLTIAFTGTVPSKSNCNGAYNGTFNGNLTVSAGQNCVFVGGGITGNLQQNGGSLTLIKARVAGNLQIGGASTFTLGPGSTISGNLQIQSLPIGSALNQVCGSTVQGNLQFQSNGAPVVIGSLSSSCAGNTIAGNLQVQSNTGVVQVDGNTVRGNLQVQSNTGATDVSSDKVSGILQCSGNLSITGGADTAALRQGQCAAF
jgi:hypothetical protein